MKDIPVVERDGRFFLQFEDGELERTPDQMREMVERHQGIAVRLAAYEAQRSTARRTLKGRELKKALKDKQELAYVAINRLFEMLKQKAQNDFINGESVSTWTNVCDLACSRIQVALAGLTPKKKLLRYQRAGWKDFKVFLSMFPKSVQLAKRERKAKAAQIQNLTELDVQSILKHVGMGIMHTRPGEWAAAFRALAVKGVLKGNPYQVAQWAQEQRYTDACIRKTISSIWGVSQAEELETYGKAVFNKVARQVDNILKDKIILSANR